MNEFKDYRQFLSSRVQKQESDRGKKANFSLLTRKAGFTSRSYIKEVLEGKKNITQASLPKFIRAFDLKGSEARFFECLVALDNPEIDIGLKNPQDVHREFERVNEKLKRRSLQPSESVQKNLSSPWAFKIRHVGEVYAALGTLEDGASLDEIQRRTELSPGKCQHVLNFLIENKAIVSKGNRFFVNNLALDIFGLGKDSHFRAQYLEAVSHLHKKGFENFDSREQFFFHSNFSVSRSQMPKLKEKLKELILEFIDESQADSGDKIAKLTLGFYL
jgi:uncharacterized protein (TIGR02147 family)